MSRLVGLDPTGSSLDRVEICNASAALPQIFSVDESEHRDRGTAIHLFLSRTSIVGRDAALAEVDEQWRDVCADVQIARLAPQLAMSSEIAVAYDWQADTGRVLQLAGPRRYEVDVTREVPATLDVVGADMSNGETVVYVGDYKGPYGWLPAPERSLQLGVGALAVARAFGADAAVVEYIRIRGDGTTRKFSARLDVFALDAIADRVRMLMTEVDTMRGRLELGEIGAPNVTEGPHCRYCPARQHCPAKTALVRHVLGDPQPVPYMIPLTPESALRAYQLLAPARAALAQVEGALYAYAKLTPIPVGIDDDGSERWFGELRRPGSEVLDGAIAHAVLAEKYDGEAANKAVTMKVTKTAITDLARSRLGPDEKLTHVTDAILEEIRARNGATRPETTTTTEYTVSPDGEAKARKRKSA